MRITVTVKPNARQESVERVAEGEYRVCANASPVEGKANERVVELLSQSLGKPRSAFTLVLGHRAKKKVFEVG